MVIKSPILQSGGTAIRGLTAGQTYFVRNVAGNTFQVSQTLQVQCRLLPEQSSFNAATNVSGLNIFTNNKFSVGDIVTYSAGSGTAIGGLQITQIIEFSMYLEV